MTVFRHELRQGRLSLAVWTLSIGFMLGLCILIYPSMAAQMDEVSAMFSQMGGFSRAFGMDRINFGSFPGFFSVECGNVLGLGGGFYAALIGIQALAKEESGHTAEFLLAHPISRRSVVAQKLLAVLAQVAILNLVNIAITAACVIIIGEEPPVKSLFLMFTAYFLMQVETAAILFGISAFLRTGGAGLGLGLAAMFYFLNIVANLMEETAFLKYFTPYGYTDGAQILTDGALCGKYLAAGAVFSLLGIASAFIRYQRKDIG